MPATMPTNAEITLKSSPTICTTPPPGRTQEASDYALERDVTATKVTCQGFLWSADQPQQRLRVRQIGQQQVRLRRAQLVHGVPARRHGHRLRADRAGALHVQRRVADHPDALRRV